MSGKVVKFNPFSTKKKKTKADPEKPDGGLDEHQKRLLSTCEILLQDLASPKTAYTARLESTIRLNTELLPMLIREIASPAPNVEKSVIAARAASVIKDIAATIIRKRDAEHSEEVDPNSPKIQLMFGWFLELFHKVLVETEVDEITRNNIFQNLSQNLLGWEDVVAKSLKGLSAKAFGKVSNPLLEKYSQLQEQSKLIES